MQSKWVGAVLRTAAAAVLMVQPASAQVAEHRRVLDIHVTLEQQNQSVSGSLLDGGRFQLTLTDVGTFEIEARITDARASTFRVVVFRGPEGAESSALREAGVITARLGVPVTLPGFSGATLVVERVREPVAAASGPVRFAGSTDAVANGADQCCVSCGTVTACGCGVIMECGWCCMGACCDTVIRLLSAGDADAAELAEARAQCAADARVLALAGD